ncbi:questin oxygenase tpcI [Aspergillus homomorphus CBS 101889]|uniref:Oxidoreductase AflY n=1 Tax=Aspergillus homomorphus (strain CBS 101889) TaxID=1450537 RepID=A0A395HY06_ASPHC|nr:hypothetical protein BO97DRAFT_344994 [Aspergillus homomorphus CBS 101889]RAL12379.1 hypothetical protein BO97DRAFT_344994 [Aspergillus homomorphus CBS 101889]
MATATQIRLQPPAGVACARARPPDKSLETASRLLQKNHNDHHIFWRPVAGHNHVAHSVLNILALGGGPRDLQRAFNDGVDIQVPMPPLDEEAVARMSSNSSSSPDDPLRAWMGRLDQYPNFLHFFSREIEAKGAPTVIRQYCFGGTSVAETMFANLFEGLYHPLIHMALGVEFEQPGIVAEGLAQAACHDSMGIEPFLVRSEARARTNAGAGAPLPPLMELLDAVRDNEALQKAAHGYEDGPARVRDGILGAAGEEITAIAADFRVPVEQWDRRAAEMYSCAAYLAGAAQRPGKARKVDFFHLHTVTSALGLMVLLQQPWIRDIEKARLLEWKTRVDLVWYAATGAVELRLQDVADYKPRHEGWDWERLYQATLQVHDDGHLAKVVRALRVGEQIVRPWEQGHQAEFFPITGPLWLRIAQMAYDSSAGHPIEEKWIWGVGFDQNWAAVPAIL